MSLGVLDMHTLVLTVRATQKQEFIINPSWILSFIYLKTTQN